MAAVGFMLGILFLLLLDTVVPHLHLETDQPEGMPASLKKTTMLVLAVTLHNIPEGMAVGVVFAGVLAGNTGISLAGAFALSIGIAIQNFPEGAIISMPLKSQGMSKSKAFPPQSLHRKQIQATLSVSIHPNPFSKKIPYRNPVPFQSMELIIQTSSDSIISPPVNVSFDLEFIFLIF